MAIGPYPATRFRRTKQGDALRRLVLETSLGVDDLIWPVFLRDGTDDETPVPSMPGVSRLTVDRVVSAARDAADLGIP
ncbi:MAG: porphobilinogen synthase, partial [Silicimonas sp.]|nr:porphobilinogen synthase [Silicimonas sp.]